jgi:hypothetical protein
VRLSRKYRHTFFTQRAAVNVNQAFRAEIPSAVAAIRDGFSFSMIYTSHKKRSLRMFSAI